MNNLRDKLSKSKDKIKWLENSKASLKQDIGANKKYIDRLSTGDVEIVHSDYKDIVAEYSGPLEEFLKRKLVSYYVNIKLDKMYRLVIDGNEPATRKLASLTPNYKYIANAKANIFKFVKSTSENDKINYRFGFDHSRIKYGKDDKPVEYPYLKVTSLVPNREHNRASIQF
jgi:hypothetical protein